MSIDAKLTKLVREYFASRTSFDELASWVQDQEPYWATLPQGSAIRSLAGRIMLMAYEVWDGSRSEPDAREAIREVAPAAAGLRS